MVLSRDIAMVTRECGFCFRGGNICDVPFVTANVKSLWSFTGSRQRVSDVC